MGDALSTQKEHLRAIAADPSAQHQFFSNQLSLKPARFESTRRLTNAQLLAHLQDAWRATSAHFSDFAKAEQAMLNELCKERERNSFLQEELSQRDRLQSPARSPSAPSERPDDDQEQQYIAELEQLLQQARAQLLSTKLQASDFQVENLGLRNQVETMSDHLDRLVNDGHRLQEEVDRLRQEAETHQLEKYERGAECGGERCSNSRSVLPPSSPRDTAGSAALARNELQKQIEHLNRQVLGATKNAQSLEQVEAQLLVKLDRKEAENYQLRKHVTEMREEIDLKSDACAKAQKIIQRLSEKSDQDEALLQRLQQEERSLREQLQQKSAQMQELTDKLASLT